MLSCLYRRIRLDWSLKLFTELLQGWVGVPKQACLQRLHSLLRKTYRGVPFGSFVHESLRLLF